MEPIVIKVTDKVPELVSSAAEGITCDNSDYTVVWQLDEEWAQFEHRTMQVNYRDGTYERVLFTGDTCALPAIPVKDWFFVGLFAGDIHTTRPLKLFANRSITTDSGEERTPMPNGYAQAIKALDGKLDKNQGAENAGKAMVVDEEGNVVPGEAGSSYTLPVASPDQLGGVKPMTKTDEMTQSVGVDEDGALYTKPGKASDPVQSDWQQNDETAADYVKNRPGGYDASEVNITWDGVVGDRVTVDAGSGLQYVKISDDVFNAGQIIGGKIAVGITLEGESQVADVRDVTEDMLSESDTGKYFSIVSGMTGIVVIREAPFAEGGLTIPERGVYSTIGLTNIGNIQNVPIYTASLTSAPFPVKIPQKYLDLDDTLGIAGATVGQVPRITAVDAEGKPTAWEAVDMPSGGADLFGVISSGDAVYPIDGVTVVEDGATLTLS